MRWSRSFWVVWMLAQIAAAGVSVMGQGPENPAPNYPLSSFRFNFILPGSRATGMGQAFIALADDATGSETNPAGLTALVRPQVFFEGRMVANSFLHLTPTDAQIAYDTQVDRTFSPTFISAVYPLRDWAFGVYRQELANYEVTPHQPTVVIPGVHFILFPQYPLPFVVTEFDSQIDISVDNYGATIARRWGEKLNVGVSLRGSRFSYHMLETKPKEYLPPNLHVPDGDSSAVQMHVTGTDWAFSWVGGFILKPAEWFRFAGVYRSGSGHEFSAVFNENVYNDAGQSIRSEIPQFQINVPDRYGLGIALLPMERLTITADWLRIEYGDLTDQFVNYIRPEFQDDYGFENGHEIHLGVEYTVFWGNLPISLRGGFYTDADNTLHFLGDRAGNDTVDVGGVVLPVGEVFDDFPRAQDALFPKVGRDYHGTFGVGLSWKEHLQTDFAADLSRDTDYVVFSVLYNF